MTVAFIGFDKYARTVALRIGLQVVINNLIVNEGAKTFLFNNGGYFDSDCYSIVSQLKKRYPHIERHYYHGGFDYDVGYVDWMKEHYDKVYFPPMGIPYPRYLRDRKIIDACEVLVTCYDNDQLQAEKMSATALAVEYALIRKKKVINLYTGLSQI